MKTTIQGNDWFPLFQAGDRNAFRQVFDRYYRPISYFARKILRDDAYAEDIVSETFRKAWDNRERFATSRHLENFLYLVTRNGCISHLRSGRADLSTAHEWVRMSEDNESEMSAIDLERAQTRIIEAIFEKLQEMPGGDVLRLSYIEGKSTKEIATRLNISENNVYIIKCRSLKVLRTLLTKHEWMFFLLVFLGH